MQVTAIGLDIATNVFQVHGIDANEKVVVRKQLRRSQGGSLLFQQGTGQLKALMFVRPRIEDHERA